MADRSFDVAIVGAGAAGCVMAARLSEDGARSVVLLEAGGPPPDDLAADLHDGWKLPRPPDWGFTSEPNEAGAVAKLRRCKVLGGTGWMTRFALRGSPADFDEWAALGNPGWSYEDVLPAFRRLEADAEFGDRPWHGDRGPIPITRYPGVDRTDAHQAVVDAAAAVGFPPVDDHNAPGAVGIGPMPMSASSAKRATTLDGYLATARGRSNLTVRSGAEVAEVTIAGRTATGLRLVDGTLVVAGLVVLCAGTYGSPSILMRSGIGPSGHLRSVGVEVLVDLPGVGSNLADHPATDTDVGYAGPARTAPQLHTAATFHSRSRRAGDAPDLMLWLADPEPPGNPPQLTIGVVLLKPRARGSVRLRSADPTDPPRIRLPEVSADPIDMERLAEGYRRGLEVAAARPVRRLIGARGPSAPIDQDDLPDRVRAELYSAPHVVGTCAMGPSPADGAVVDADGRVHGLDGLMVADASIIPTAPSGFTHLPTIMLAERISERLVSGGAG